MSARSWENWEVTGYSFLKNFMRTADGEPDDSTRMITGFISALPKEMRNILDVGCGPGLLAYNLHECLGNTFDYHGIDITPTMIRVAKERCSGMENISFALGDIFGLSSKFLDSFPVVICKGVLEHLPDVDSEPELNYKTGIQNLLAAASVYILICIPALRENENIIQLIPSDFPNGKGKSFFINRYNRKGIYKVIYEAGAKTISEKLGADRSFLVVSKHGDSNVG